MGDAQRSYKHHLPIDGNIVTLKTFLVRDTDNSMAIFCAHHVATKNYVHICYNCHGLPVVVVVHWIDYFLSTTND